MADNAAEFTFDSADANKMLAKLSSKIKETENGQGKFIGIMSTTVFKDVMDHFKMEEGSEGKWKPWSQIYQAHMEKIGRAGNKKLQFSGKLRQSFQPGNVKKVSNGLLWYNNAMTKTGFPYAEAHDEGGPTLPKRDFMWLSEKAIDSLSQQLVKFALDEEA